MRRKRFVAPVKEVGTVLAILRTIRGLSQVELAKIIGLSSGLISDYERGKIAPSLGSLQKLLRGMDFELSDLEKTEAFLNLVRNQQWNDFPAVPLPGISGPRGKEIDEAADEAGRVASRALLLVFKLLSERSENE